MSAPRWGTCTTVKAPLPQVLAFVAHHLGLGAQRVWLFFDDPDDPAAAAVEGLSGVRVVRCDDGHWRKNGTGKGEKTRPEAHQVRQSQNVGAVYRRTTLDWLVHLDIDEFIWPSRPIPEVLAEAPADAPALRMAPWEALHDPALPDDIFTAHAFRRALKGPEFAALKDDVFGPYAEMLDQGAVSHAAGKCFFRAGVEGLSPRIHTAMIKGERLILRAVMADVALLHFHAQDRADWIARLPFRATKGAYRANPPFFVWYSLTGPTGVEDFYNHVQMATPDMLNRLRRAGALIEADLGLRAQVARLAEREGRVWPI